MVRNCSCFAGDSFCGFQFLGSKCYPIENGRYTFLAEVTHTHMSMGWFSARKIAADTQVVGLEREYPQPIDILMQAGKHSF
jgi:hypothetical protein